MRCFNCGREIKDGVVFCVYCGKKVLMKSEIDGQKNMQNVGQSAPVNLTYAGKPNGGGYDTPPMGNGNTSGINNGNNGGMSNGNIGGVNNGGGLPPQKKGISPVVLVMICIVAVFVSAIVAIIAVIFVFGRSNEYVYEDITTQSVSTTEVTTTTTTETTTETTTGESTYEIFKGDMSWSDAQRDCISRGGHLVTFDTEEEYEKVMVMIKSYNANMAYYMGASRDESGNSYYWINKDLQMYGDSINGSAHWLSGEPSFYDNYSGVNETATCLFYSSSAGRWVWNDIPDNYLAYASYKRGKIGYVCEYDG